MGPAARAGKRNKQRPLDPEQARSPRRRRSAHPRVASPFRGCLQDTQGASSDPCWKFLQGTPRPPPLQALPVPSFPGMPANPKRCFPCHALCRALCSLKPLPPSQRQLPSPLLWLPKSTSLSAFEFQSRPDCKQMDGVIKIPQAKRFMVVKERLLWKNESQHPCWFSLLSAPTSSLRLTQQTCCLHLHLSTFHLAFKAQHQSGISQVTFYILPSQTLTFPATSHQTALAFELLGYSSLDTFTYYLHLGLASRISFFPFFSNISYL